MSVLFTYWGLMIGTIVLGVGVFALFCHLRRKWLAKWAEEHYPAGVAPTTEDLKNHVEYIEEVYGDKDEEVREDVRVHQGS